MMQGGLMWRGVGRSSGKGEEVLLTVGGFEP